MNIEKEGDKLIHKPSTQDVFNSLSGSPNYSEILLANKSDLPYSDFLRWLVENKYFKDRSSRITVKGMAADFKSDAAKISKWLRQIYDDIFELNESNPELFQKEGIKVKLNFKTYDSRVNFHTSLPALPRIHETVVAYFFHAKLNANYYWIDDIEHVFHNGVMQIIVFLKGGFINRYREFLLDRAVFEEYISLYEAMTNYDFRIDEKLKKYYQR